MAAVEPAQELAGCVGVVVISGVISRGVVVAQ